MKTLYLLRHAKSSWGDAVLPDRDRPLEARGVHDATRMGKRWSKRYRKPDLIVSSPALRAVATARLVAERLDYELDDIVLDGRLYAATADALISLVEGLDDKLERVMLVGHNPGFTELACHFDRAITRMPTCALVELRFDAKSWAGIGQARPAQVTFDSPRSTSNGG